jgi:pimeloyl-ACP methyl ester carboxylesterase
VDSFERDGLRFDVRDAGPSGGEPVSLLHGFPEDGSSWDRVVPALHRAGYRTLAPDQRGYSPGARPTSRRAYSMKETVADVAALADAAGLDRFHLVGHDWGGFVAWGAGAVLAERVTSLTVVSTPHPRAFVEAMPRGQVLRSWYMAVFQLPALPERMLLRGGPRGLAQVLVRAGLDAEAARRYATRLQEPGALTGALNWYRALPFNLRSGPVPPVTVPTLYLWSDKDVALGHWAAERTARYVTGPYRFVELPGVSHWIPEEAPDVLVDALLPHLAAHPLV